MFTSLRRIAGIVLTGGAMAPTQQSLLAVAHVDAQLDGAGPGLDSGWSRWAFPPRRAKPATTRVEVRIPEQTPLRTVRAEPVAGWTLDIQKRKIDPPLRKDDGTPVNEVVSTVTWSAVPGAGIPQGQFQEFALYVGPLPDADALALPTTQTFADGSTEAWTEQSSGADKPKFPVPSATIGQKAPHRWTAAGHLLDRAGPFCGRARTWGVRDRPGIPTPLRRGPKRGGGAIDDCGELSDEATLRPPGSGCGSRVCRGGVRFFVDTARGSRADH